MNNISLKLVLKSFFNYTDDFIININNKKIKVNEIDNSIIIYYYNLINKFVSKTGRFFYLQIYGKLNDKYFTTNIFNYWADYITCKTQVYDTLPEFLSKKTKIGDIYYPDISSYTSYIDVYKIIKKSNIKNTNNYYSNMINIEEELLNNVSYENEQEIICPKCGKTCKKCDLIYEKIFIPYFEKNNFMLANTCC